MPTPTAVPALQCPLCGQANQCAVALGLPPEGCWCMAATVEPEALARVAASARGTVCICPACAQPVPPPAVPAAQAARAPI